jgi:hypothetical protein
MAVFFSGGQEISFVEVEGSYGDRPRIAAAKITGPAEYSIGTFYMQSSYYLFHFIHDPTHRSFVVVAGTLIEVTGNSIGDWLDIIVNFETDKPDLELIQQSYEQHNGARAGMKEMFKDRIWTPLTENLGVLVELQSMEYHHGNYYTQPSHILNIRIIDKVRVGLISPSMLLTWVINIGPVEGLSNTSY